MRGEIFAHYPTCTEKEALAGHIIEQVPSFKFSDRKNSFGFISKNCVIS